MTESVAPEFVKFVSAQRALDGARAEVHKPMASGDLAEPVVVDAGDASELIRVAAKRAAGFFRPTKRTEIVWVSGGSQLAVNLVDFKVTVSDGLIVVAMPVRCDQVGNATIEVVFAVGSPDQPAGFYASAFRRPSGPALIVDVWREALVAFAWRCVLEMVAGLAGAVGKDSRGNVLVPAELTASDKGLAIVPMARHRFAGSTGLKQAAARTRTSAGPS